MPHQQNDRSERSESLGFIDYFFYILAGSAFAALSYSFLLWLQF